MLKLAIDIDGTIFDTIDLFLKKFYPNHQKSDILNYDIEKCLGDSWKVYAPLWNSMKPEEIEFIGGMKTVQLLRFLSVLNKLRLIDAFFLTAQYPTNNIRSCHKFHQNKIYLPIISSKTKLDIDFDILVEDRGEMITDLTPDKVIFIDQPWNHFVKAAGYKSFPDFPEAWVKHIQGLL